MTFFFFGAQQRSAAQILHLTGSALHPPRSVLVTTLVGALDIFPFFAAPPGKIFFFRDSPAARPAVSVAP